MKICIDVTPIGVKTTDRGGVYRYISKLITFIGILDRRNQYILFFNFYRREHLPFFNEAVKQFDGIDNFHITLSRFPTQLQRLMDPPMELLSGRFDLFHGCFDYLPRTLFGRRIVTIHDLRYFEDFEGTADPEWIHILRKSPNADFYVKDYLRRDGLFAHIRKSIQKTIERADAIITVSEFSKKRIQNIFKISAEKIRVIYHGVDFKSAPSSRDEIGSVMAAYGINRPYILYVGKFDPLKNLVRLLEAVREVVASHDVCLVLAGSKNWYYHIVRDRVEKLDMNDRVVFTDYVTDKELSALYRGAEVFAMPSLYEGFGIPLLEAMRCGTPIVASNVCSIPEVTGGAALLVDPYSSSEIGSAISRLLADRQTCNTLVSAAMERARQFTWQKTANETLRGYEEVLCG